MLIMKYLNKVRDNLDFSQFFFLILLVILSGAPYTLYNSWDRFARFRGLERPDYANGKWSDCLYIIYFAPLITAARYIFNYFAEAYLERQLARKYSGDDLKLKLEKSWKNGFKIIYFSFITAFGFYVFSDTPYQSPTMHGSGVHLLSMSDWPYNNQPWMMKIYYMLNASYHFEGTVVHLLMPMQNDFFEMLLHHYITLLLIVCSYMTSFWSSGINVMIQMDNGDILAGVIKCFYDIYPAWFTLIVYVILVYSWIYYRLYAYTLEVIYHDWLMHRWNVDNDTMYHRGTMLLLLVGLLVLNIYWTLLFFRMGWRFIIKGEVKDIQNQSGDNKKHKIKAK